MGGLIAGGEQGCKKKAPRRKSLSGTLFIYLVGGVGGHVETNARSLELNDQLDFAL